MRRKLAKKRYEIKERLILSLDIILMPKSRIKTSLILHKQN